MIAIEKKLSSSKLHNIALRGFPVVKDFSIISKNSVDIIQKSM